MIEYVGYIIWPTFILLLSVSFIAVLLFSSSFFKSKINSAVTKKIEAYSKLVGSLTAVLSLMISIVGIAVPLRPAVQDDAKVAIEKYFQSVQKMEYDAAYNALARARIEEIRRNIPNFNVDYFKRTYETTRVYENINVSFKKSSDNVKLYTVTYDAIDETPRNVFFGYRKELLLGGSLTQILNQDGVLKLILENLERYYIVPDSVVPTIKMYVGTRQLQSLVSPFFLSEIVRNLESDHEIKLRKKQIQPSQEYVTNHFVHQIQMVQEGGAWKIRSGLANPVVAVYEQ